MRSNISAILLTFALIVVGCVCRALVTFLPLRFFVHPAASLFDIAALFGACFIAVGIIVGLIAAFKLRSAWALIASIAFVALAFSITNQMRPDRRPQYLAWWQQHREDWKRSATEYLDTPPPTDGYAYRFPTKHGSTCTEAKLFVNAEDTTQKAALFPVTMEEILHLTGFIYAPGSNAVEPWMADARIIEAHPVGEDWFFIRISYD